MILAYKLVPLEVGEPQPAPQQQQPAQSNATQDPKIAAVLEDYGKRLETIEKQLAPKGGAVEWPKI